MGVIPGEPTDVVVTEATKSYVVLAWKPPEQRGHEGVMYYIEKVRYIFFVIIFLQLFVLFFFCCSCFLSLWLTSFGFLIILPAVSCHNLSAVYIFPIFLLII